ncbi:Membrane associated serine protease [Halanaeroarchaeum sp. HSR-CO]|uniref:rhomboid family intramembrane serine protease n=1 Tax=Halanaeroarchaeum sp. HSR-CO TaxID=2866382 RepID=UPI00217F1121|nr:rhomboid family intramembrane serine protease [Halanaeroarchaeum sp. HSR-CO]UWG46867.1 Membrane associated serine protease [Halanaeroarchaeum sp. HSR-CO]
MDRPTSPTIDLLLVFGVVYAIQLIAGAFGIGSVWFALATPLVRPWTLVTTVYAHASIQHLVTNAVSLALVGFALERFTTRFRFHAFVLATGSLAALAEVLVAGVLGRTVAVLGASGAILALFGYVLTGNRLVDGLFSRLHLGHRTKLALIVAAAVVVTLATAERGVALIAHSTGFAMGIVAGRYRLLRVD